MLSEKIIRKMSKKILLVNTPFYRLLGSHYNANSLGIAYIASYLNEHGHDSWVYNGDFVNEDKYKLLGIKDKGKARGIFERDEAG